MKIYTKEQVHELTEYFKEVLEEMIDNGCSPEIVSMTIHSRKSDAAGTIYYNSWPNTWLTNINEGTVYTSFGKPHEVCPPESCVDHLIEGLTNSRDKAKNMTIEMLNKAKQEGVSREAIQDMLKEIVEENSK